MFIGPLLEIVIASVEWPQGTTDTIMLNVTELVNLSLSVNVVVVECILTTNVAVRVTECVPT